MLPTELLLHVSGRLRASQSARAMYAERLAPEFTPFEFIDTRETSLSRVIAWLLDPRGSHAQGPKFLDAFMDWLALPDMWSRASNVGASVRTEVPAAYASGFLDILVQVGGAGLVIENKPYAEDQEQQVGRYLRDLEHRCPAGQRLVYLSAYGDDPSELSLSAKEQAREREAGRLAVRSYAELTEWLDRCESICRAPSVSMLIGGFSRFIRQDFIGVTDMDEADALAESIASSREMVEAAVSLLEAEAAIRRALIARFIEDVRKEAASRKGWTITYDDLGAEAHSRLVIAPFPDALAGFGFQFDQPRFRWLFYGILREDGATIDKQVLAAVEEVMGKCSRGEGWLRWRAASANDRFFPLARDADREFWLMLHDGRLAQHVITFVDDVTRKLKAAGLLGRLRRP